MTVHREQSVKREKTNKMQQSEVDNKHLIVASCWFSLSSQLQKINRNVHTLWLSVVDFFSGFSGPVST